MKAIDEYLNFLWQQFQYDWSWMTNPWVLYTFFPVVAYLVFFCIKWTVLLAPITIPIMVFRWPVRQPPDHTNHHAEEGGNNHYNLINN